MAARSAEIAGGMNGACDLKPWESSNVVTQGTLNELNIDATHIFEDLVEEIILDIAIEQHRDHKLLHRNRARDGPGSETELDDNYRKEAKIDLVIKKEFEIREKRGKFPNDNFEFKLPKPALDVFGRSPSLSANELVICIVCGREFAANRYAAHLEKCVGKGRRASRDTNHNYSYSEFFDDDDDDDDDDYDQGEEDDQPSRRAKALKRKRASTPRSVALDSSSSSPRKKKLIKRTVAETAEGKALNDMNISGVRDTVTMPFEIS